MKDFDITPIDKTFFINGNKITKRVELSDIIAFNNQGKPNIEKKKDYPHPITILFDYDDEGNLIHEQVSTGLEYWYKYDDYGNKVYMKTSQGDEVIFEYDEFGNCVYSKSSRGIEFQYRYNNKNQKYFEYNSRFSEITLYQYDKNNNYIRSITSDGLITKNTYDVNNNLILSITSRGSVEYHEYDDRGNIIYSVIGDLFDEDIDVENYQLNLSELDYMELFFEYDFYPDGKIQRQYTYEFQEE